MGDKGASDFLTDCCTPHKVAFPQVLRASGCGVHGSVAYSPLFAEGPLPLVAQTLAETLGAYLMFLVLHGHTDSASQPPLQFCMTIWLILLSGR